MSQIRVLDSESLDLSSYSSLQRVAFARLLSKSGVSDHFMMPEHYEWKYTTPAGAAKIAVVFIDNKMVASNAMFPLHLRYKDKTILAWQSCDTATLPEVRGRGYYSACLNALKKELQPDQLFFGFPNSNSIRGFGKLGCEEKAVISTWVNPFPSLRGSHRFAQIYEVESFDDRQDQCSEQLIASGGPIFDRCSSYLNWRYHQHPIFRYKSFVYREDGVQRGFMVLRKAEVGNMTLVLVMEIWGLSHAIEHRLLKTAKAWAKQQKITRLLMMSNSLSLVSGIHSGYFPVPSLLLPKRQVLMGFATGGYAEEIMQMKWRVNLGDWDGF
jgi:hypothetical protein